MNAVTVDLIERFRLIYWPATARANIGREPFAMLFMPPVLDLAPSEALGFGARIAVIVFANCGAPAYSMASAGTESSTGPAT